MMKAATILLGIVLIITGTVAVTYDSVTITTRDQQALNVGPLTASTESSNRTVRLPTVVGGAVVAAGIAVVLLGSVRRPRSKPSAAPGAPQPLRP